MAAGKEFDKSIIEKKASIFADIAEVVFVILIAVTAVIILRTQASMGRGVDGQSMQPTYNSAESGYKPDMGIYDKVYITKLSKIRRGDIIVFEAPKKNKLLIKRVIGLPGDTLEFKEADNGTVGVWRNGKKLEEDYIKHKADGTPDFTKTGNIYNFGEEIKVPKGHLFVMGDNRDNSEDSRFDKVGFVPLSDVEGKVYLDVPYGDKFLPALWHKVFG